MSIEPVYASRWVKEKLNPDEIVYAWVDMETTGLQPPIGRMGEVPLEVGLILTDRDLNELAYYQSLIVDPASNYFLATADPIVKEMHKKSGLTAEIGEMFNHFNLHRTNFLRPDLVGKDLREFLDKWAGPAKKVPMAGSTINFDRHFMGFLPDALDWFHYRNVDVSTLKVLCRNMNPTVASKLVWNGDEKKHRVLADIRESVHELKFYRDNFLVTDY